MHVELYLNIGKSFYFFFHQTTKKDDLLLFLPKLEVGNIDIISGKARYSYKMYKSSTFLSKLLTQFLSLFQWYYQKNLLRYWFLCTIWKMTQHKLFPNYQYLMDFTRNNSVKPKWNLTQFKLESKGLEWSRL